VWALLALLAALLWPLDVAVRRLVIEAAQVQAAARRVRQGARDAWDTLRGRLRPQPVHEPTLGRLLRSQEQRKAEPQRPVGLGLGGTSPPSEREPAADAAPAPPREQAWVAPAPSAPEDGEPEAAEEPGDALSRLKAAKRRARREKSD